MRASIAAFALLALGCHDPAECATPGAQRCGARGTAIRTCRETPSGLRWRGSACTPPTPSCVERRDGTATCIGEALGSCDEATFEPSCVDEHTLDTCTGTTRHRTRCAEGESCGAVSEDRFACYAPRPRHEPPALVAYAHGDVRLGDAPAPPVPFRVPEGTTLSIGEDARVIVLVKERPSRLDGPREIDPYTLQPEALAPEAWAEMLVGILAADPPREVPPEEPLYAPAPSEDGLVRLFVGEGLPGASTTIGRIAWRCAEAGPCARTLELRAQGTNERVVWRGNGEPGVRYEGPDLEPGETYQLRVGEREYRIETSRPPDLRPLLAAMRGWSLADRMAVVAAVHRWNGSRAAAAETLRRGVGMDTARSDAQLRELLEAYGAEGRAAMR